MVGRIEERARVQPEPIPAESRGDRVHVVRDAGGRLRAAVRRGRRRRPDRGGHHQRPQHAGPGRRLGRLLGAVPEHLPDPPRLPQRRHHPAAGRRAELLLHRHLQPHLPLHPAQGPDVRRRRPADRAGREVLRRPHPRHRRPRRPRRTARQPRPGGHLRQPRHRLPPRQARRHLPLRPRHAGAVDRRPRRLPGPRPAQGRGRGRLGAVQARLVPGGAAGRPHPQRRLPGLRQAAERRGDHPLLPGLRRYGRGAARQEGRRHLPGARRRRHSCPPAGQRLRPPAGRRRGHRHQLPGVRPEGPLGRAARRAQGRRPARRPGRDRAQGLQGHRRPAVLDGAQGPHRPHHRLLRRLRRPEHRQGPRGPPGRGHPAEGPAHPLVHLRPLRVRDRPDVPGAEAAAGRLRAVHRHPAQPPLEDLRGRLPEGRVPGVRPRLVPGLPRRGQLHRALHRRAQRARHALPGQGDHRDAAAALAGARRPRADGQGHGAGPADPGDRRPAAPAVAGPAVRGGQRRHRRRRTGPRPLHDHDDVGPAPEDQLVRAPATLGRGPSGRSLSVAACRF
ncbi:putative Cell division protein FtsI (Peptidoglycan synthetase) [Streptomyces misionensis JCM 4497]